MWRGSQHLMTLRFACERRVMNPKNVCQRLANHRFGNHIRTEMPTWLVTGVGILVRQYVPTTGASESLPS